jgi:hypothetical protein
LQPWGGNERHQKGVYDERRLMDRMVQEAFFLVSFSFYFLDLLLFAAEKEKIKKK